MEKNSNKAMFFGKVTASVTHEIQNVLAIIKETSGLVEDFIQLNQTNGLPDFEEKLGKCLETIKKQAYRGVSLTSSLNSFAHTPDNIQASIDLHETAKKLIIITDRLFKQKNVTVEIMESTSSFSIITDPVILQMVLFYSVECLIDTFQIQKLTINIQAKETAAEIIFSINDEILDFKSFTEKIIQSHHWIKITELCQHINFIAKTTPNPPGILLSIN